MGSGEWDRLQLLHWRNFDSASWHIQRCLYWQSRSADGFRNIQEEMSVEHCWLAFGSICGEYEELKSDQRMGKKKLKVIAQMMLEADGKKHFYILTCILLNLPPPLWLLSLYIWKQQTGFLDSNYRDIGIWCCSGSVRCVMCQHILIWKGPLSHQ